ncbi:MAG: T9SS type A sorting domain-containing protein [Bacteroidota bacterium]|nr:T9SS type A sorting domain-containing protein [Bacteroidota bacterium]
MKLTFLLFLSFSLLGIAGSYADNQKSLTIQTLDGSEKKVTVTEIRKLTFLNDQLIINYTDGASASQALSTINKLYFSTSTGLKQPVSNSRLAVYPNPVAEMLTIINAAQQTNRLTLFSLDGTVITRKQFSSGEIQLDMSTLANGLYLLNINNQTFKIRVQK